ncbi:MAG: HD-GYP domain-containing protein [Phycisphaerales bacterium]
MTWSLLNLGPAVRSRIAARAEELGVLAIEADGQGSIRVLWAGSDATAPELEQAQWRHAITRSWGSLCAGDHVEAIPGVHCIALGRSAETDALVVCVVAAAGCESAELRSTLVSRLDARGVADVACAMRWFVEGAVGAETTEITVADAFAEEVSSTYEQISVLYQLVRSMNGVEDPHRIVTLACGQMLETLDFDWFAACFDARPEISEALRGRFLSIGDLPCEADEFRQYAAEVVRDHRADRWSWVLRPEKDRFARRLGDEMLLELIAHDGKAIGALFCGGRSGDDPDISSVDIKLVDAVADFLGVFHENVCRFQEQREMFLGTLHAMTGSVDAKDPYTRGHSDRVAHLAFDLAVASGMSRDESEQVRIAGLLHDVGKIGVPERVLLKAGRLDDAEFDALKRHPAIGHEILQGIRPMAPMLPGVLHHHERWDGRGYPHGLAGESIPRIARILALADAFDAMSSNRAYRDAMPREKVLGEIARCAGSQFDPQLAQLFVGLDFMRYDEMVAEAKPQSKAA